MSEQLILDLQGGMVYQLGFSESKLYLELPKTQTYNAIIMYMMMSCPKPCLLRALAPFSWTCPVMFTQHLSKSLKSIDAVFTEPRANTCHTAHH